MNWIWSTGTILLKKKTDGGACLTGHLGKYTKNSCSYAWQAHEDSKKERKDIYDVRFTQKELEEKYPEKAIPTNAYEAKSGKQHPAYYAYRLRFPKDGDWDLDGPKRKNMQSTKRREKIPKGKNFTKCYYPYWHNAHHLIPKGLFNDLIEESGVDEIIRSALLEGMYNINHMINTMILPQDKEVGCLLKLPRHLTMMDPDPGEPNQTCNHPQYTKKVEEKGGGKIEYNIPGIQGVG